MVMRRGKTPVAVGPLGGANSKAQVLASSRRISLHKYLGRPDSNAWSHMQKSNFDTCTVLRIGPVKEGLVYLLCSEPAEIATASKISVTNKQFVLFSKLDIKNA